jgi:hypothetical protein
MTIVQGQDVNVYVWSGSAWVIYACGTSCSVDIVHEIVRIATVDSGADTNYDKGLKDKTIYMDGVVTLDSLTKWQMWDALNAITVQKQIKVEFINSWGDEASIECAAYISHMVMDGQVQGAATWAIEWKVCGALTINDVVYDAILDSNGDPVLDSNGEPLR